MTSARLALPALLLAATLTGCTDREGKPVSEEESTLTEVRETCLKETAASLAEFTDKLTAEQFFDGPDEDKALRVVTPEPVANPVPRSEALNAAMCVFREAGAPKSVVRKLSIPAIGQQTAQWQGFTGTWESDNTAGYRAEVIRG